MIILILGAMCLVCISMAGNYEDDMKKRFGFKTNQAVWTFTFFMAFMVLLTFWSIMLYDESTRPPKVGSYTLTERLNEHYHTKKVYMQTGKLPYLDEKQKSESKKDDKYTPSSLNWLPYKSKIK